MALTKADIAEMLFDELGLNKREAKELVDYFFEEIRDSLANGRQVKLSGFGNFDLRDKSQRPGRNPKTGEEIPITARRVVLVIVGGLGRAGELGATRAGITVVTIAPARAETGGQVNRTGGLVETVVPGGRKAGARSRHAAHIPVIGPGIVIVVKAGGGQGAGNDHHIGIGSFDGIV